jgi:hypothetical protein
VRTGEESVTEWALPEDADNVILSARRVGWRLSESGGAFRSVEVQDLELKHTLYSERHQFGSTASAVAFSPTGDSLVISREQSEGSSVELVDLQSTRAQPLITIPDRFFKRVAVNARKTRLLTFDANVELWSIAAVRRLPMPGRRGSVVSGNGLITVTVDESNLRITDAAGAELAVRAHGLKEAERLAVDIAGTAAVVGSTASSRATFRTLKLKTRSWLSEFSVTDCHPFISAVAVARDAQYVCAATYG